MQVNERKSIIIPRTKYGTVNFLKDKIKVAAYARVSTDREEQEDSFERQVDTLALTATLMFCFKNGEHHILFLEIVIDFLSFTCIFSSS